MASPAPVLPEVPSTTVPPGCSSPASSAASIIATAARSFTLPPGFTYSSFAKTGAVRAPVTRLSRTRGVPPTASTRDAYTSMPGS